MQYVFDAAFYGLAMLFCFLVILSVVGSGFTRETPYEREVRLQNQREVSER